MGPGARDATPSHARGASCRDNAAPQQRLLPERQGRGEGFLLSHALHPSAANQAMETTQPGQAFIFQPDAMWESAVLPWNQHKSSPRSLLLLSPKKKKEKSQLQRLKMSAGVEN